LTGTSEANRLEGRGGADTLRGLGGDDTLEGGADSDLLDAGSGDDLYVFKTNTGESLGSDTIIEAASGGIDSLDFSGMPAGLGTLDLNLSAVQTLSDGLLNLNILRNIDSVIAGEIEEVVGTDFGDKLLGNALENRLEGKGGNDWLDGRDGSDVYVYSGRNLGSDLVFDASAGSGRDTLDFVGLDSPINLDLALTTSQNLGEVTVTLGASDAIENVLGTSFDDTIYGNTRDNSIFGAAGADYLNGRAGNDRLVADLPAVVLLDFDSAFRADRGDYNYTAAQRAAIELRLKTVYAPFNWTFTQSESLARELSSAIGRNFVRLAFSQGRGGGVSGDAGEVDFRNIHRRLTSEVNINPLLPAVRELVAAELVAEYTPAQYEQMYSSKIVALTATIAAHELAHTAGLRHADAFGPIGSGIYELTDVSQMYPEYAGLRDAHETPSHVIASPASVGTSISDAASETYFGERESIKLAFNEIGRTRRESTGYDLGGLHQLYVPNLLPATGAMNSGKVFDVSAVSVIGDLNYTDDSTEFDTYRFEGRAGEWVNIELMAAGIRPLRGEAFDGALKLYRANGSVLGQLLAENDDEFEGTKDAHIQDVLLIETGSYFVTVSRSPEPALEAKGGRYELLISRFRALPAGSELPPVAGDTLIGGPGADIIHGAAADDLILATDSVFGDLPDDLLGGRGNDTLDMKGLDFAYTAIDQIERIINRNVVSFSLVAPSNSAIGQTIGLVLNGSNLPTGAVYIIDWGDGLSQTVPAPNSTLRINHAYATASPSAGFAITVSAKSSFGVVLLTRTQAVVVTPTLIVNESGQSVLFVGGTAGNDVMTVRLITATTFGVKVSATAAEVIYNYGNGPSPVQRLAIFGMAGNDTITIASTLPVPAELYGGDGNDSLRGGAGDDVLIGGEGNDNLYGFGGRDLLIGGAGRDAIYSDGDGDILVSGWTLYDTNREALRAISTYWSSDSSNNSLGFYQTRVNTLRTNGINSFVFNSSTTFDDNLLDTLSGEANAGGNPNRRLNWYVYNTLGSGVRDSLQRKVSNEISTDIGNS
jgi:Ca2+-binding RTX toxin-like protein